MTPFRKLCTVLAMIGFAVSLAACKQKTFEKAGKAVDRAVQKTGDGIKDATRD